MGAERCLVERLERTWSAGAGRQLCSMSGISNRSHTLCTTWSCPIRQAQFHFPFQNILNCLVFSLLNTTWCFAMNRRLCPTTGLPPHLVCVCVCGNNHSVFPQPWPLAVFSWWFTTFPSSGPTLRPSWRPSSTASSGTLTTSLR